MVDAVVARAVAEFGGVDILVNNAGIMDRMSAAHETDDAEWERVLRIDLTAPFLLTRAVLPHMLNAGTGCLVFTGSEAGLRGGAAGAAYTAAKHGITGLGEEAGGDVPRAGHPDQHDRARPHGDRYRRRQPP